MNIRKHIRKTQKSKYSKNRITKKKYIGGSWSDWSNWYSKPQENKGEVSIQFIPVVNGEIKDDQENIIGHYTGNTLNGKPYTTFDNDNDNGTMIYTNGSIYNGKWNNGLRDGSGKMEYSKYNVKDNDEELNVNVEYNGLWEDGKMKGIGTQTFKFDKDTFIIKSIDQNDQNDPNDPNKINYTYYYNNSNIYEEQTFIDDNENNKKIIEKLNSIMTDVDNEINHNTNQT